MWEEASGGPHLAKLLLSPHENSPSQLPLHKHMWLRRQGELEGHAQLQSCDRVGHGEIAYMTRKTGWEGEEKQFCSM